MERKFTYIQYNVQDNSDVEHQYVRMYCNTSKLPELPFCGTHSKPHGANGLSKHYHLRFDPKLYNGVCLIHRIPCTCDACTSMLDKPGISVIQPYEKERYKPVTKCTYWLLLGSFNNWNIIQFHIRQPLLAYLMVDESYLTFHQIKKSAINLSPSALIGQY